MLNIVSTYWNSTSFEHGSKGRRRAGVIVMSVEWPHSLLYHELQKQKKPSVNNRTWIHKFPTQNANHLSCLTPISMTPRSLFASLRHWPHSLPSDTNRSQRRGQTNKMFIWRLDTPQLILSIPPLWRQWRVDRNRARQRESNWGCRSEVSALQDQQQEAEKDMLRIMIITAHGCQNVSNFVLPRRKASQFNLLSVFSISY